MQSRTHITVDFETRSEVNLKETGAWRYAEDPTTEILCLAYKIGDDSPQLWAPHLDFPQVLYDAASDENVTFEAHNVQFERAVWTHKLPHIPLPKYWEDTLAACAYRALPLALEDAGEALDLPIKKDKYGKHLINLLCKPRTPTKKDKRKWREDLGLMEDLYEYCKKDTEAEYCLRKTIGPLTQEEQETWVLDQKINERGVFFDLDAINAGLQIVEYITKELTEELQEITKNKQGIPEVESHDKLIPMRSWLRKNDVDIPNMQAETVNIWIEKLAKDSPARRVLEIRRTLAKASIKKLNAMLNVICRDGKAHGMLQYHGASTGRWAGRLIQPHNLPRGDQDILKVGDMDGLVDLIKKRDPDIIGMIHGYERIPDVISTSLRGMIIATPGNELYVGDFSTIEARQTMWVCNQMDAVKTFADYDKGIGQDIYCTMATDIVGYPVNKNDHPDDRQLGKITVLGCFEEDTPVLTNRGWIKIVDVNLKDKLWDGEEWVDHEGLLYQGRKQTMSLKGIGVTPDHMIMTQEGWVPAYQVGKEKESFLKSALLWANSRLPDLKLDQGEESWGLKLFANAEMKPQLTSQISEQAVLHNAMHVLNDLRLNGYERMKVMGLLCQMTFSEICGLVDMRPCLADAINQRVQLTSIMGKEELKFVKSGMIEGHSSLTYKGLKDGIIHLLRLIGLTTTETMSQEISEWRQDHNKTQINVPVYDILNSGPNHRFTILTKQGPIVVSNCGYQMGADRLQSQAEEMFGVLLTITQAESMVNSYRNKYQNVRNTWYNLQEGVGKTILEPGTVGSLNRKIYYGVLEDEAGKWLVFRLPNKRKLWFYEPECEVEDWIDQYGKKRERYNISYMGRSSKHQGKWMRIRSYGGMMLENIVQALARDTMVESMKAVEAAGYPVVLTVHDEVISDVPKGHGSLEEFTSLMAKSPDWAPDCPITVEAWKGERYRK